MNNTNTKRQIFILFANRRIECHHSDSSILQWKAHDILYISPKGIKNTIPLSQVQKVPELNAKFIECLNKFNLYGTEPIYFCHDRLMKEIDNQEMQGKTKMSIKINEFRWFNPEVQEIKDGYAVKSDCGFANVVLKKNLYIVEVTYPQYIGGKKGYANKRPNMTKILLQKYNYEYSQFPSNPLEQEKPQYFYVSQTKRFTIFNIPNEWKYSLRLIWASLITHQVIPFQFCYIDYSEQEMPQKTPMPQIEMVFNTSLNQKNSTKEKEFDCTLPLLGKINHHDQCLLMKIEECEGWFSQGCSIMADQFGFWFVDNLVTYRRVNRPEVEEEYHPRALPCVLRRKNEPERSVAYQLKLFISYKQENRKVKIITSVEQEGRKNIVFDNENNLINQQTIPDVGNFKAFSNGIVIVKFVDRSMLTMNSKRMEVKIIKSNGQTCHVDLGNTDGYNFQVNKPYITYSVDFQQRTFFPQQWLAKQQYNKGIQEALEDSETLKKASLSYLKL